MRKSFILEPDGPERATRTYDIRITKGMARELREQPDHVETIRVHIKSSVYTVYRGNGPKAIVGKKAEGTPKSSTIKKFSPREETRHLVIVDAAKKAVAAMSEDQFEKFFIHNFETPQDELYLVFGLPASNVSTIDFSYRHQLGDDFSMDGGQQFAAERRNRWLEDMNQDVARRVMDYILNEPTCPHFEHAKRIINARPERMWNRNKAHAKVCLKGDVLQTSIFADPQDYRSFKKIKISRKNEAVKITGSVPPMGIENIHRLTAPQLEELEYLLKFLIDEIDRCLPYDKLIDIAIEKQKKIKNTPLDRLMQAISIAKNEPAKKEYAKAALLIQKETKKILERQIEAIGLQIQERSGRGTQDTTMESRELTLPHRGVSEKVSVTLPKATKEAIDRYGIDVLKSAYAENTDFFLTQLRQTKTGYKECLFYVLQNGVLYPRIAYKSKSSRRWRISSNDREHDHYGKGIYSYTAETIPCIELDNALNELEHSQPFALKKDEGIKLPKAWDDPCQRYSIEVFLKKTPPGLEKIAVFSAPLCFEEGCFCEDILNPENIPDDFVPDFKAKPVSVSLVMDSLDARRKNRIEQFRHTYRGKVYNFFMASDGEGRVWIEKIQEHNPKGNSINTYGIYKAVLDLGILSSKPFEYLDQANGLNPDRSWTRKKTKKNHNPELPVQAIVFNENYADVTPTLDKLKIIQRYREARNIIRKTPAV